MKTDSHLVGGIDMGTTKVSALVGERSGEGVRVIGVGTTSADGLRQGVVVDIEKATQSVRKAVREAQSMAGVTVGRFNVGVAGEHIRSMNSRGVVGIPDADGGIGPDDVARSLAAARNFALPTDREIVHTLPQQFIIDNQSGIREPSGMYGSRLEARAHVVTASRSALDNIERCVENAGCELGELVLEPLASGHAVLSEEEKEIGVMLIDIGGGTTDVLIYDDLGVAASGVIGIGGNNVTSDIAYGLRTALRSAERVKVTRGCALSSLVPGHERVEVEGIGFRETKTVDRQVLAGIIEPRVKELLSLIDEQITKGDLKRRLGAGVVLTGGASMLEGTRELAEQVFDLPVRIGNPYNVGGLTEVVNHPRYATGVGLLLYRSDTKESMGHGMNPGIWWRQSFSQLRRAIASFI